MSQDFFHGKSANYNIGATAYSGNKGWSVHAAGEDLRTDNTAGNGYSDRIIGTIDCPFTIEQDWDASANPMDDPPALFPGSVLTNLKLQLDSIAVGPYWLFPKALILNTPMTNMVESVCHLTINGGNKGRFYHPAGTFTPSSPASQTYGS